MSSCCDALMSRSTHAAACSTASALLRDAPETEQLLELVGDDEQAVAGVVEQLSRGGGQSEAARVEQRPDFVRALRRPSRRPGRRRSASPRVRFATGSLPGRKIAMCHEEPADGQVASVERGKKAGAHQRGLAAARHPDDGHEPPPPEPRQQIVALFVAPEKQRRLVRLEGPQPGKGIPWHGRERCQRRQCRRSCRLPESLDEPHEPSRRRDRSSRTA